MKKSIVCMIAAALLLVGLAGQSMAAFGTGDLIRIIYSPGSTYEYATDLGSLTNLENTTAYQSTPIAGSSFTSYAGTGYSQPGRGLLCVWRGDLRGHRGLLRSFPAGCR